MKNYKIKICFLTKDKKSVILIDIYFGRRGWLVPEVKVINGNLEDAIKRFKRQSARNGIIQEIKKREFYEKPSVKRKRKAEAARKRKALNK